MHPKDGIFQKLVNYVVLYLRQKQNKVKEETGHVDEILVRSEKSSAVLENLFWKLINFDKYYCQETRQELLIFLQSSTEIIN